MCLSGFSYKLLFEVNEDVEYLAGLHPAAMIFCVIRHGYGWEQQFSKIDECSHESFGVMSKWTPIKKGACKSFDRKRRGITATE